jgi:hypothetical protein
MTIAWKNRKVNLMALAACLGVAAVGFVSTDLSFSPFLSLASDGQRARTTEYVIPIVSPSFLPEAIAAMPRTSLHESFAPGSDSRLDDYRLEHDSCCIGN